MNRGARFLIGVLFCFALLHGGRSYAAGALDSGPVSYYLPVVYKLESHPFGRFMFNTIAADLKFKKNIVLNLNFEPVDNLVKELRDASVNGGLPTIAFIPAYLLPGLVKDLPVAPIPNDLMPDMDAQALAAVTIGSKFYAMPFHLGEHLLLYYNKKLVATPAKTWKELIEQHEAIGKQGVDTIIWPYSRFRWFTPFWGAFGGWLPTTTIDNVELTPLADSLDFYKALRRKGQVSTICDRFCQKYVCNERCEMTHFAAKKVAYMIGGDWSLREAENPLGSYLGVAPLPALDAQRPLVNVSSPVVAVFFNDAFSGPQAGVNKAVVKYLSSKKVQESLFYEGARIPALRTAKEKILVSDKLTVNQKIVVDEFLKSRSLPVTTDTTDVSEIAEDVLRAYLPSDDLSAQDAALMLINQLQARRKLHATTKPIVP